jgi:hypothetical protein
MKPPKTRTPVTYRFTTTRSTPARSSFRCADNSRPRLFRIPQPNHAFDKALLRHVEIWIELKRLVKRIDRAFVPIEMCEIASAIQQHGFVSRQDLEIYDIVFLELDCSVSQAARLQMQLSRIMKIAIASELKDESTGKRLIVRRQPMDQFFVFAFSH